MDLKIVTGHIYGTVVSVVVKVPSGEVQLQFAVVMVYVGGDKIVGSWVRVSVNKLRVQTGFSNMLSTQQRISQDINLSQLSN
ncbi:hypothetical protein SLE2022_036550 [Rubroshorea leprosula]